ncbi:LysR family transcriptional regulator [Coralloluteibacterium stylophorae]|uniref:LysR family transcriptional regulator n=1 Tax=Coralloluteibacterium stylophorae TaxID=1776034 RepID=A0A8J8AXJ1_9GAMM|nr:LysR family transcriptional regulator [Coralloluteibacterium stylophorae]MBS7456007.1 LysR family transcriptional regulator [Coralloluteibacterium stylophorae]
MQRRDLNDLAAFAAVARERSFTRAAAALGLSPSALSHAMRGLEDRLGVRLLARTTRSVAPTDAGERLLQSLEPALAEIEQGLLALGEWRGTLAGSVRLTTFSYAALMVLEPKLPGFLLAHPGVQVEVSIDNGLTDLVAEGFDAGIRFGEHVDKDMIAVRVGPDLRTIVVGTPDYFSRHPPPRTPADLERHACIGYRLKSTGGLLPWEFEHDGRDINMRVRGPLIADEVSLALAATRAGVGLGYVLDHEVAEDLAAGRLVQVLDAYCPTFPGYHLYHPSRRQTPPALRALIDWLKVDG